MYTYSVRSNVPAGAEAIIAAVLGIGAIVWILGIAAMVLIYVGKWKVFKKANVNGWEALIPVHSDIVEMQLGGIQTSWWFLNIIVFCGIGPLILHFWRSIALAKAFGKGGGFGVLLAFFPYVCYPILAFGSAQYVGTQNVETQNNVE